MAKTVEFKYAPMFQVGEDKTEYRLLTKDGVTTAEFEGKQIVKVSKEALTLLAQQAFHDVEFMLRRDSCVMPRLLPRVFCLSVRIQVQPLSMVRRDSRSGRASRMRKP